MRASSLLLVVAVIASTVHGVDFRCDYEYEYKSNRFYKYHEIPATWDEAQLRCYLEGAILASPLDHKVATVLRNLIDAQNIFFNNGSDSKILIGLAAKHSKGDFLTIEGVPEDELAANWSTLGQPKILNDDDNTVSLCKNGRISIQSASVHLPYVCYKKNETVLPFRPQCGTTDTLYSWHPTGSCYKFHREPRIWSSAHMACRAVGGYLVVINSKQEAEIVRKIFAQNPANTMIGNFTKDWALVGFSDWNQHGTWRTVQGESLEQAGYNQWQSGQPNNGTTGEFCGSVYRDALFNDIQCTMEYPFICEKDPLMLAEEGCNKTPNPYERFHQLK